MQNAVLLDFYSAVCCSLCSLSKGCFAGPSLGMLIQCILCCMLRQFVGPRVGLGAKHETQDEPGHAVLCHA